jgi:hypothetical protein
MVESDAFRRLKAEHQQTLFVFYGPGPSVVGTYAKHAHSLREALADLNANPLAEGRPFVVTDAFVDAGNGQPTLHVEVMSADRLGAD